MSEGIFRPAPIYSWTRCGAVVGGLWSGEVSSTADCENIHTICKGIQSSPSSSSHLHW